MKKINPRVFYFTFGAMFSLMLVFISGILLFKNDTTLINPVSDIFTGGYRLVSPKIPSQLDFAGERIPVENFEVYERMDREFLANAYWHSATILAVKRANRWFPVIESILKRYNIPDDFKYMAVAESNLENVVSPAGAAGFWQLMEATGKKYGLEINTQVDERYHVEKATEAACRYLLDSYSMLGNWTAAAASYNMGQDGIKRQQEKQKSNDYFNLVLNSETLRFVCRIVSLKYILTNPGDYGFELSKEAFYKPLEFNLVSLNGSVNHFADYAASQGINYAILKYYNPWLRDYKLDNTSGKQYLIKIPKEGSIKIIK